MVRQFQTPFPKAMDIFESGIDDALSYLHSRLEHRTRISSNNPLEGLNRESQRRTRVIDIFPNAGSCPRSIGMILIEQNEDWLTADKVYLTFDNAPTEETPAKLLSMAGGQ